MAQATLGLDLTKINLGDKTTWPKSLQEIVDRTNNIHDAGRLLDSSAGSGSSIESEWLDFLSNWDALKNNTVPLTSLSLTINQGPSGFATAELPALLPGEAATYQLTSGQLIQGFHDPDGDPLAVTWLTTDHGDWFCDNGDGTWSINPNASGYDATYVGPLELSYSLEDGHGHSLDASQLLLVVGHLNHAPSGSVAISGSASQGQTLNASHTLADLDGIPGTGAGAITYQWKASGSTAVIGTGSTYTLTQAEVGKAISVTASYIDGYGTAESVTSQATAPVAATGDTTAPTLDAISLSGLVVGLIFSEPIDATGLATSAFAVQTVSGDTPTSCSLSSLAIDATNPNRLLLTLGGKAPASNVDLRVSYTDPNGNQSAGVVQDKAGNDLISFTNVYASSFLSSVSVSSLAAQYRELILTGTSAINGSGNANANTIFGNAAANVLTGGLGDDTLIGGAGNETYDVDSSGDVISELANEGTDLGRSSVTFSLAGLPSLENLTLTGSAAINASGNTAANTLTGNGAANALAGDAGQDILIGGAGADLLTGGLGNDTFRYSALNQSLLAGIDRITDFAIGGDSIDGPTAVSAANLRDNVGIVSALSETAIQVILTSTTFVRGGAATFTYGSGATTRTFLALNDGNAGFSVSTDAIIEITGYSGSLANLAVI